MAVAVHPLISLTVTEYVPAPTPLIVDVVAVVLHAYVYGEVPPLAVTVAAPVLPPKHNTLVTAVAVVKAEAGWVILAEAVIVQLFASVIVTVFTPDV